MVITNYKQMNNSSAVNLWKNDIDFFLISSINKPIFKLNMLVFIYDQLNLL